MVKNETFTIRQMIELTGLSEFTIRGWENRYKAFKPRRGKTGRREYLKTDIERALLIRELLKRGFKISKMAGLSTDKLQHLFKGSENTQQSVEENKSVSKALELMALQKWVELSNLFKATKFQNSAELIHEFILPILSKLAQQVQGGLVSIAQEHIISTYIKEKIYTSISSIENSKQLKNRNQKIKFVLVTPENDHHEIGLLMAHLMIRSHGYTSLYLGPHTPAQDLSETSLRFEASHILISSSLSKSEGAKHDLLNYVSKLQDKLGSNVKFLLAGRQAPCVQNQNNSSVQSFFSFHEFESYLMSIERQTK